VEWGFGNWIDFIPCLFLVTSVETPIVCEQNFTVNWILVNLLRFHYFEQTCMGGSKNPWLLLLLSNSNICSVRLSEPEKASISNKEECEEPTKRSDNATKSQ